MSEEGIGAKGLKTKLIINYLPQAMGDADFETLFSTLGPLESCKVMRDRSSGYSFGYGFVDYQNPRDAELAIEKLNGYKIENKTMRVAFSKPPGSTRNVNLYLSGLTKDVNEGDLEGLFSPYGELVYTRILRNGDGSSKCVGFVLFKEKGSAEEAIRALQGHEVNGEKLQIKYAKDSSDQLNPHPKYQEFLQNKFMQQAGMSQQMGGGGMGHNNNNNNMTRLMEQNFYGGGGLFAHNSGGGMLGYNSNTNGKAMRGRGVSTRYNPISRPMGGFGGGGGASVNMHMAAGGGGDGDAINLFAYFHEDVSEGDVYALFSRHGRISKVDVVAGKGYAFVHMPIPAEAFEAVRYLNGQPWGQNNKTLQVSVRQPK